MYVTLMYVTLRMLEEVVLEHDKLEALKLHDVDGLEQIETVKKIEISQSIFAIKIEK